MKYIITIREIMDKSLWVDFCNLRGWNEWCVNEGLADMDEEVILTDEEAKELGLTSIK